MKIAESSRTRAARNHRHSDADLRDGLFRANVVEGNLVVTPFTGGELEPKGVPVAEAL